MDEETKNLAEIWDVMSKKDRLDLAESYELPDEFLDLMWTVLSEDVRKTILDKEYITIALKNSRLSKKDKDYLASGNKKSQFIAELNKSTK